jgi:hypothetical protein
VLRSPIHWQPGGNGFRLFKAQNRIFIPKAKVLERAVSKKPNRSCRLEDLRLVTSSDELAFEGKRSDSKIAGRPPRHSTGQKPEDPPGRTPCASLGRFKLTDKVASTDHLIVRYGYR